MEYRELGNTGLEVSVLGFGASSLGGVFHPVDPDDCLKTVRAALDGGINFFDVSPAYGETLAETNLGKALKGIARDRYYLATKVGSYSEARGDYDYSAARTERSLHQSLSRLGVDYVDLVQCHDIEFADRNQILEETLPTLHRLKEVGLARFIGITGLPLRVFPNVLDNAGANQVDTILSFCHYELNDHSLLGLLALSDEKGSRCDQRVSDRDGVIDSTRRSRLASGEQTDHRWLPKSGRILPNPGDRYRETCYPVCLLAARHRHHPRQHCAPEQYPRQHCLRRRTDGSESACRGAGRTQAHPQFQLYPRPVRASRLVSRSR